MYAAFHVECMMGVCQAGLGGILRDHTKSRPGLSPWAARRNGLEAFKEPRCPGPVSTGLQRGMILPCALATSCSPHSDQVLAGCPGSSRNASVLRRAQLQAVELRGLHEASAPRYLLARWLLWFVSAWGTAIAGTFIDLAFAVSVSNKSSDPKESSFFALLFLYQLTPSAFLGRLRLCGPLLHPQCPEQG